APRRAAAPSVPPNLDETYEGAMSTQEAFGRVLGALGRRPEGDAIVTASADVAVTTHLAGWINRKGVYAAEARPDPFADAPQAMAWRESPAGRHIELGIAEHNLFLLLGAPREPGAGARDDSRVSRRRSARRLSAERRA